MRKPRLEIFFLIDFSTLVSKFSLTVILGSGSISVKDVQTYLCNLTEAEAEPKPNRASNTDNTDDADDADDTDDTENADDADDTDDADDVNNAENAENAENADDADDTDD